MANLNEVMWFQYHITLDEGRDGGLMEVEGVFQRADAKNANGRVYPRKVLESAITSAQIQEALKTRGMLGELDHPADGKTSLNRVSHFITELRIEPTGDVIGKATILNTPEGQRLQEYFRAGLRIGISSRGAGSVAAGTGQYAGAQVVQEDFRLSTFDFVVTPSTFGAYPTTVEGADVVSEIADDHYSDFGVENASYSNSSNAVSPAASGAVNKPGTESKPDGGAKSGSNVGAIVNSLPQVPGMMAGPHINHPRAAPLPEPANATRPVCAGGCGRAEDACACPPCDTHNEGDQNANMNKDTKEPDYKRLSESLARQLKVQTRIQEADRAASGRFISTLLGRLRAVSVAPRSAVAEAAKPEVKTTDTSALESRVAELESKLAEATDKVATLTSENMELRQFAADVQDSVDAAEDVDTRTNEIANTVENLIGRDADAADWKEYLMEATDVADVNRRHKKMKRVIAERADETLPKPGEANGIGAKKRLNENRSDNPSLDLFRRTRSRMGRVSRQQGISDNGVR